MDGKSVSVAEISGAYTGVQATLYARCVKRAVEACGSPGTPSQKTELMKLAKEAKGSAQLKLHSQDTQAGSLEYEDDVPPPPQVSRADAAPARSAGEHRLYQAYQQFELRSGGVTVDLDKDCSVEQKA